jgi:UDP:flavonoid glycosyltransferase YjiC (YdhE family)
MRILLATHGTRGDVQPMIALALALRARGHDVAFVAPANFVDWIAAYGFRCESDGVDVEAVLRRADVDIHSFRSQMRYFRTLAPQLFQAVGRASVGTDLIVGAGVQLAGASIADLRGVPYVNAVFCPCVLPSRLAPPPIRWQTLPPWVNRLLWRFGAPAIDALLRGPINAGRAEFGLSHVDSPMKTLVQRPTIVAAYSELGPLPVDAPSAAVQTDAWILEQEEPLDPTVDAFISAGPPPIYVGFGSMVAKRLDRLVSSLASAAARCRCRMIVAGGWAALHSLMTSSTDVLVIERAPHQTLFPRVAAVVHHGGAGTTAAAARAGVPQMILPHLLDQYYWAHRIEVLGLGPKSIRVEGVTPGKLAERIDLLLHEERFRDRAREMGVRVAARNGAAAGAEYLEGPPVHRRAPEPF